MKYKALMLDVDGTTIPNRKDGKPSVKVREAIKKAQKLLHVGIVTGRPFFEAEPVTSVLSLTGPSILSGGAQVVNIETEEVLWEKSITIDIIKKIHNLVPEYTILVTDGLHDYPYTPSISLTKTLDAGIRGVSINEAEKIRMLTSRISSIVIHTVPSWTTGKVDILINHVSATKLHGIYEVAKILGIETHEIIGVGDGGNDLPLLMACGLKVAMGNANPDLKAIADYVTPSVDEDGVADVIEKFILNP